VTGPAFFACLAASAQSAPPGDPEANPGRPTVSTPATLTPQGYVQFETGVLDAGNSPEFTSQVSLQEVIKLTVASRLELLAQLEPWARSKAEGEVANDLGDVAVGAQVVLLPGAAARPTVSASYLHRVYSGAAADLDVGGPSNSAILLASADVKGFHYDANAMLNELVAGTIRRGQFGQTLSISHPLPEKITLSGEIWHFSQPFLRGNTVGNLWAVSFSARNNLVFDAAFNRGLTATSTHWQVLAGVTYLLPYRLFGR